MFIFEAYRPFLEDGAYILFDDLHAQNDGVLEYFESLSYYKIQDDQIISHLWIRDFNL